MSNDFNIDNAGSGFALDDDEGLEAMMRDAQVGEEERENGSEFNETSPVYTPAHAREEHHGVAPEHHEEPAQEESSFALEDDKDPFASLLSKETPSEHSETSTVEQHSTSHMPEENVENVSEHSMSDEGHDSTAYEVASEMQHEEHVPTQPEPSPEPSFVEPQPSFAESQPSFAEEQPTQPSNVVEQRSNKIHVPSMNDELSRIELILRVADTCRSLSAENRTVVGQFLTQGEDEEPLSESELVLHVLTSSPTVRTGIKHIKKAKSFDPVERAFYIIELRDDELYNMGDLITIFSDEGMEPNRSSSRTQYARQLVKCVENLDQLRMQYIEAIQSVLSELEESR